MPDPGDHDARSGRSRCSDPGDHDRPTRATGFVWFFSFLVLFSQVKKSHGDNILLLLDEPGLSLHAKAQSDLLRYFKEQLAKFEAALAQKKG